MDNTFSNSFDCIVKLNNPLMGTETLRASGQICLAFSSGLN